ncbi:388_t:CDS:2, partial [Cetraspora pellucida]
PTGFTMPLSSQGLRWTGFFHSENKREGNRYTMKCKYCLVELNVAEESSSSCKRTCDEDISVNPTIQEDDSMSESSILYLHQETIAQFKKLHQKLLKAMIYGNNSFYLVENPYFQDFLNELNPSYHLPS